MITTKNGTTVEIEQDVDGERLIIVDHPDAPADMRHREAGRLAEFGGRLGFQPAPFAAFLLSPDTLRAIADLIEGGE